MFSRNLKLNIILLKHGLDCKKDNEVDVDRVARMILRGRGDEEKDKKKESLYLSC